MFVQQNTVKAIRTYVSTRLKDLFSPAEIRNILNESICYRLGISRSELILKDDELLSESDLLFFRNIVKRLQRGEPFQYILGFTHFYGLEIKCDSRALIPRPETEELVDWVVNDNKVAKELKALDLCTGTGCIALALDKHLQSTKVTGIDVSPGAIDLATENNAKNKLTVTFEVLDVLDSKQFANKFHSDEFDIWVSNPPYIPEVDKHRMERNVLDFEPHLALFVSDHNPLIFYHQIIQQSIVYLKSKGLLYFEIHEDLADGVIKELRSKKFVNIELRKDLQGKNRLIKAQKL